MKLASRLGITRRSVLRVTALGAAVIAALYVISVYNFLLFHSIVEFFSIVVAFSIFVTAWNARGRLEGGFLPLLGVAYLFVGSLDFLHTLAYAGMGVFPGYTANLPTQLWIAARSMESLSILASTFYITRRIRFGPVFVVYSVISALLVVSIFYLHIFPTCYVEGIGLTPFKKMSEYVISAILLVSAYLVYRKKGEFTEGIFALFITSIVLTVCSEVSFVFYVSVYGFSNMVGHILKVLSFYLIYRAIVIKGIREPYDLIFRNLRVSEESLRKLNSRLTLSAGELRRSNEELEQFAYVASHDLQEPLRIVASYAQLLEMRYRDKLDADADDFIAYIVSGVKRMQQLIEDLLNYSRVGTRGRAFKPVDCNRIVAAACENLAAAIGECGATVAYDSLPTVTADASQLTQLFQNLIGNAVKFRADNAPVVNILAARDTDRWVFSVKDNGIGIPREYGDRIFAVFQRLHGTDKYPGTGIGLAIARKIVERHGGVIWVDSQIEEGATFRFTIPDRGGENLEL
jgi:signal transduction histidine kinase